MRKVADALGHRVQQQGQVGLFELGCLGFKLHEALAGALKKNFEEGPEALPGHHGVPVDTALMSFRLRVDFGQDLDQHLLDGVHPVLGQEDVHAQELGHALLVNQFGCCVRPVPLKAPQRQLAQLRVHSGPVAPLCDMREDRNQRRRQHKCRHLFHQPLEVFKGAQERRACVRVLGSVSPEAPQHGDQARLLIRADKIGAGDDLLEYGQDREHHV
mmetsp:Transcript_13957/g.33128  ORF Transcript_13957/g.33128 Transcript_13957/m.33128 type:complete len:215 (+) Transcript_13957:526-1170(+)